MSTEIEVILPALDATQSIETASFTPVDIDEDMIIVDALKNKNNSLAIIAEVTTAGTLTIKAGDNYPNAILGDLAVALEAGTNVIRLQDISRFENKDGSVGVAGDGTVAGTICAVAKRAGITPADDQ